MDFTGITKDEHAKLTQAAKMYHVLLGDSLEGVVARIPVQSDEPDPAEKARKDAELLETQAAAQRSVEESQQRERKARQDQLRGDASTSTPAPGPIPTEKAREAKAGRKGTNGGTTKTPEPATPAVPVVPA